MSQTGEAAEQIVNMATNVTVKGVECVANLSGKAAVSLAAFLIAALKDEKRVSGKTRMRSFRGKPTQVFVIQQRELRAFAQEAKKYGVLYAAVVDKRNPDGLCDIVVSAEDAARVNRIADRFALSAVDVEKIREDIIRARKLAAEHNQSMRDTEKLIQLFHISDDQARYITNAQAGSGLLRYAGTLIPFVNRFKKDTELYRLITTKPGEVQKI